MALLAAAPFFGTLISGVITFITGLYFRRFLIGAVALSTFVGLWVVFYNVTQSAISPLLGAVSSLPPFLQVAFKTLPSNTDFCISAVVTISIAKLVFNATLKALDYLRAP